MTSLSETNDSIRREKRLRLIGRMADGGLASTLTRRGLTLTGLSYKDRGYDHLIVLKVDKEGAALVAFVGSSSLGEAILKAQRLAEQSKLVFREDRYVGQS